MPVGATMKDAVAALLDRLFEYRYPAHPLFEQEVKTATLRRILERVQVAAQQADQRLLIEDHGDRRHWRRWPDRLGSARWDRRISCCRTPGPIISHECMLKLREVRSRLAGSANGWISPGRWG
jgi:hypothetical protein